MKLVLLISITCVLNSDLVCSELQQDETQIRNAPESSSLRDRQDKLPKSSYRINYRHLPKVVQTNSIAKKLINVIGLGTRMSRQVLKRPTMILIPKVKKPLTTTLRVVPSSVTANQHRFPMKNKFSIFHKKPIQMPAKEEIHETTHHHTFSEEHIHIEEEDDSEPEVKKKEESVKQSNGQTNAYLKEIEMREEKKVEAAMGHNSGGFSSEIIRGKPYDFEDDWKPIEKPKPASKLNTFVMDQPIAKQVHHHKHIIQLDFQNKAQPASEIKPSSLKENIKPASYSVINFHKSNPKNEGTSKEAGLLLNAASINADYFYNKKFKDADYLQANPSNVVQVKLKPITNELTTHVPLVTTTKRYRTAPNYSFRINPIEMSTESSTTVSDIIEVRRPRLVTERKKHKNLVAQTMNRGAIKFDNSEPN